MNDKERIGTVIMCEKFKYGTVVSFKYDVPRYNEGTLVYGLSCLFDEIEFLEK
jgi:hypothetical protein